MLTEAVVPEQDLHKIMPAKIFNVKSSPSLNVSSYILYSFVKINTSN